MTSRYVPYATTPARLLGQLISDFVVGVWIAIWVVVGMAVHTAVAAIANFGGDIDTGASGIAGNLDEAGDNADSVPLIGDALSSPLRAAGAFARDIAGAGAQLNSTATWLAWLLALAVAAPPSERPTNRSVRGRYGRCSGLRAQCGNKATAPAARAP